MRLGHAYRADGCANDEDEELQQVVRILRGEESLRSRAPRDPRNVSRAEQILCPDVSPIYAFMGCLHPKLGTIGLIISRDCLDRLHGGSRCDSGGLTGRYGGFRAIPADQVEAQLRALSFFSAEIEWSSRFSAEISESYLQVRQYVDGSLPNHTKLGDIRTQCVELCRKNGEEPDRRLWTWEIRLDRAPDAEHFVALVVSSQSLQPLEQMAAQGLDLPSGLSVIYGSIDPLGVHWFHDESVIALLCGS